jgi:hypothetical protein
MIRVEVELLNEMAVLGYGGLGGSIMPDPERVD